MYDFYTSSSVFIIYMYIQNLDLGMFSFIKYLFTKVQFYFI